MSEFSVHALEVKQFKNIRQLHRSTWVGAQITKTMHLRREEAKKYVGLIKQSDVTHQTTPETSVEEIVGSAVKLGEYVFASLIIFNFTNKLTIELM
jgi:hypothetical protein